MFVSILCEQKNRMPYFRFLAKFHNIKKKLRTEEFHLPTSEVMFVYTLNQTKFCLVESDSQKQCFPR